MIRIWAKVNKNHRIVKQCVLEKSENMDYSLFYDYVREMCETLDIPTPVVIKTHIFNYAKYNTVRFGRDDFVESIDFDNLTLDNIFK